MSISSFVIGVAVGAGLVLYLQHRHTGNDSNGASRTVEQRMRDVNTIAERLAAKRAAAA